MHRTLIAFIMLLCTIDAYAETQVRADRFTDGHDIGLIIVGAIANAKHEDNVALVKEVASGRVKAVKIGFPLLEGYKVTEVTGKYIMLKKSNSTLLVYQNKFAGEFAKQTSTPTGVMASLSDVYNEDGFERKGSKVFVSAGFRDKLVNEDLSKVLMQATAIPKIENGEIVGFKILQIDAGSIYDKAGLKDNDVITSINGLKLNSVSGAVKLLQSLKGASDVSIDVNRDGTPINFELKVAH